MLLRFLSVTVLVSLILAALQAAGEAHRSRFYYHNRKIHVVATTPTLGSIAEQIGGDKVYVTPLLNAKQDVKDPRIYRSMVQATREARILLRLGPGIDPWVDRLVGMSGNRNVARGAKGYVDCSAGVQRDRDAPPVAAGYWLDPVNSKAIASDIAAGFCKAAPKSAAFFAKNYERFCRQMDESLPRWHTRLAAHKGLNVVACCGNLQYFNKRFGFVQLAEIETVHGSEPSPAQVDELVAAGRAVEGRKLVIVESLCPLKSAATIAERTGGRLAEVPSSVGAVKNARDYFGMLESLVDAIGSSLGGPDLLAPE